MVRLLDYLGEADYTDFKERQRKREEERQAEERQRAQAKAGQQTSWQQAWSQPSTQSTPDSAGYESAPYTPEAQAAQPNDWGYYSPPPDAPMPSYPQREPEPQPKPEMTPWQRAWQGVEQVGKTAQEWGPYVGMAGVAAPLAKPAFEWANENINPRLAEYYSGPELREETGLPEQIAKAAAGPALTAAARFGREVIEKGPGEALEASKQRWKDSPEPFPGVKGAYEMAVDPFNAIPIEKAPTMLVQGAKKVGPALKAAREALPELATTARRMAADETGAVEIGSLLGRQGDRAPKEPWEMRYQELHAAIRPATRDELETARPILKQVFPEFMGAQPDAANDYAYGIWRMVNKGDEIHRVFTSDLSKRHRAIIEQALSEGKLVPQRVLSDYPDLAKQHAKPASRRYYHGTGSAFDTPDPGKFDPNGLYGPGYYMTDNPEVAGSYSTVRAKQPSSLSPNAIDDLLTKVTGGTTLNAFTNSEIAILTTAAGNFGDLVNALHSNRTSLINKLENAKVKWLENAFLPGASTRAIDVPEDLRLLDGDASVPIDEINAAMQKLPEAIRIRLAEAAKQQLNEAGAEELTGNILHDALIDVMGGPKKANEFLSSAGYDGIRYQGGQRMPLLDAAGQPIEHEAVVIFPESLPKIRNALSGTQGGMVGTGEALDIGSSATGAATGYLTADENATPEERLARAALGAAGGFGASRALRTGRMGFGVEDVSKGKPLAADIARLRPFAEEAVAKWAPDLTPDEVMQGVWNRLAGKATTPEASYAAGEAAKAFLENEAGRVLPQAVEGIQSQVRPGHILVYRTARDPREGLSILSAAEQGNAGGGFQASTHHVREGVRRTADAAAKKGKVPVFTSNYPSVSAFYTEWNAEMPLMFAMEIPEDAVIYRSSRAAGYTQGKAYGLTYPDTEIIIDANRISRIWHVPDGTIQNVKAWARELDGQQTVKTGFANAFKDRDSELASAGAMAIADLRKPPASLGRPFIEAPVEIPAGLIKNGDRVVLATGDTATAVGYHAIKPEHRQYHPAAHNANLQLSGYKGPTITGLLDPNNMPDNMVVRVLKRGERITKAELADIAEKERGRFLAALRSAKTQNDAYLADGKGDAFRSQRLTERGQQIDDMIRQFAREGGSIQLGTAIDLGSGSVGAAAGYDPNATPEENAMRMATGFGVGMGGARALRTGNLGLNVQDVSKKALSPLEKAKLRLEAAKGTPEQAAALRAPEAGHAGNVNVTKGNPANEALTRGVMDDPAYNQMAGQRRGVINNQQALPRAQAIAEQRSIEEWLSIKPGTALNQEESLALRSTTEKVGNEYRQMQADLLAARAAASDTPVQEAKLAEKALEFAALTAVRSGAAAEAGRALYSYRAIMQGDFGSQERALQKAMEVLGGGDEFKRWVDAFNQIDPADSARQIQHLRKLYQPSIWEKINAWRYASMLSSWKTHAVNTVSNAMEAGVRPLQTAIAGYPKEAQADIYGMMQGIPEGIKAAVSTLKTGVSSMDVSKLETGSVRPRPLGDSPLMRAVALPSDLLIAADDFWKAVNYSGAIHADAYRLAKGNAVEAERLLTNPSKEMVERAQQVAKYATYQNNPNEFVGRIVRLVSTPGPTGTLTRLVLPFIRTPANIYIRGLEMTLQPLIGPLRMGVKAAKGDGRAVRMEAAKTVMAATTLAGLWGMAASGNLSGQGPSDPAKRKILEESGWQSNSVRIGDRWVKYSNLGPVSIPMAAVAALKEGLDEGQKPNREILGTVADRVYNSMLDVSFVQGLSDVLRGEGFTAQAAQIASSTLGTGVPYGSGLAAAERILDPNIRAKDDIIGAVAGRIPGASQLLPTEPGIYGEPRQTGANDLLGQILLPWQTSVQQGDPVAREVARLNQSEEARKANTAVSVRQFSNTYAGAKQTPEQRRMLQGEAGKLAATYLADMIGRDDYAKLSDVQKVATLNDALRTAYELADLQLGDKVNRDPRHQALMAWASIPQYEGVKGKPEDVRRQNYEIAQARAKRTEYRAEYGESKGDYLLLKEDKRAYQLAQRGRLNGDYLKLKKKKVDEQFGGALTQAEKQGLVGAGNSLVPVGGSR